MLDELEDAKHLYLVGNSPPIWNSQNTTLAAQSMSLMVLSAGFLAVIYATETPYYYIGKNTAHMGNTKPFPLGGAAGPVILEQSGQRGGVLQIMLDSTHVFQDCVISFSFFR